MRVAIDARLNAYRQGGIPQYTRQLLHALASFAPDERFVSLQHRDMLRPLVVAPNVVRRTAYTPPHHRYEQLVLPLEVGLVRPDVLHSPDFIAPMRRTFAAVTTIHDLAFMHYPDILDDAAKAYYGQVKQSSLRAEGIIAVSESTRQDIVQFLEIPYDEINVIHEAAAPLYAPIELRSGEARVLNGVPVAADSFMLFVSTLEPRKNLPTLLQALRICVDRRPDRPYQLVIVGGRGWRDEPIFAAIRDLRLADHVLLAGNVGQYDLRWLYNACRLYINPSLYEGFGLPLLEAMACGAPCLAAAASSLPEVGGDAVKYVAPLDAEQWAAAIETLWDDDERRAELGQRGLARAQQFSWQRAARETLKVYAAAIDRWDGKPGARSQEPGARSQERFCSHCGAALVGGAVDSALHVEVHGAVQGWQSDVPQTWQCTHCGYAELVLVRAPVPPDQSSHAATHTNGLPVVADTDGATDSASTHELHHVPVEEPPEALLELERNGDADNARHLAAAAHAPEPSQPARRKKP